MAYITREDGEHFVIPSYRDVLSAKNKNLLKKDILLLSQNYGEYITLQRKGPNQYEVAFSPDAGYLLGESIWQYFKRPLDMIYCEAVPNTTEALLVIVKAGSVYLDGRFPLESIPEELIIFLTQQNNFEIYIYGDVPISEMPEENKFSFEASSVKSFTVLDKPAFSSLPLYKIYQLQLVDPVLKAHGIGVFPTRQIIIAGLVLVGLWMFYSYVLSRKPTIQPIFRAENPYQEFNVTLTSPAPDQVVAQIVDSLRMFLTIPGWVITKVDYGDGILTIGVQSLGGKIEELYSWAQARNVKVEFTQAGLNLVTNINTTKRSIPRNIYSLKEVMGTFLDRLSRVYPGNRIKLDEIINKGAYLTVKFTISVEKVSPIVVALIGEQLKDLPFVLQKLNLTLENGSLNGTIHIEALGSQS